VQMYLKLVERGAPLILFILMLMAHTVGYSVLLYGMVL